METIEGHFSGYDGAQMFYQTWPKSLGPKAHILGIHGLGEHADSYFRLAQGLSDSPYQLFMLDLRGHGKSTGKRGVASIDEFVQDFGHFRTAISEKFGDRPTFLLGHSMGGLVLAKLLTSVGASGILGAVFSSPFFGVSMKVPWIKEKSASVLGLLAPGLTLNNQINLQHLSHDPEVYTHNLKDQWRHDRISAKLFKSMMESVDHVFKNVEKIQCPVLAQIAGEDLLVDSKKGKEFFEALKTPDKTLHVYEGFYHEIYNEVKKDKPIGDLIRWLNQKLK